MNKYYVSILLLSAIHFAVQYADERQVSVFLGIVAAVADDEFVKVKTKSGNAVIINESEWNILIGAMKIAMNSK